ncbi:alpha/beta fold hydrolase [Nonomuraea sp. NPDC050404]|uniref:alpha/beta fold hydrolase n=1 Tax=Nonomuraea sp. NPDC050404 TaxID=3155783 RepID=UPI003407EDDE
MSSAVPGTLMVGPAQVVFTRLGLHPPAGPLLVDMTAVVSTGIPRAAHRTQRQKATLGAQSMIWWEEEFCTRLAEAGRQVVRYDHRDTGRSTSSPPGRPSYTAHDLTPDPLRILDALGVGRAHLVGLSMGGGIALEHAERVSTLCLASTSPAVPAEHDRRALAAEIPGAYLVPLPGAGHQQPPRELWDLAIAAIVEHTAKG